MSDEGLYRLYKLHLVDTKLNSLKARAAALDTGNKEAAVYKKIQSESKEVREKAKSLRQELNELENRKISNADKADNYEKKLFDGSITSHKEIDDLTREVKELREADGKLNRLINELKPKVEAAEKAASESKDNMAKLKEIVLKKQEKAKVEHAELEKQFKHLRPERDTVAQNVDPMMLREYQAAIKKTGNTGMALITEAERCEACGIDIPEKTIVMVSNGKAVHCESCRRVLFILVPEV